MAEGETCNQNADCEPGLFCKTMASWPFESKCSTLLGLEENCNDDYECLPKYFCWYASASEASSGTKRCLTKYGSTAGTNLGWATAPASSSLTDNEYNGLACETGLATNTAGTTS